MAGSGADARYPHLAGRTVFVSGGGSGIGAAFVRAFAGQGASVAFIDIGEPPSLDAGEMTDKGSINQKAVLKRRRDIVERLYGS